MDAFEQSRAIHEIVVVMHPDWLNEAEEMIRKNSWAKVKHLISGGRERWESSWNAIRLYQPENQNGPDTCYWFHDAARPFVSQRILTDVAQALETHAAVTVALPVTDTLYHVAEGHIADIPSRSEFMRAQTPQAFRLEVIEEAFRRAMTSGQVAATDDVGIVHRYMPEVPVYIVAGEETNRKITYIEDIK